MCGHLFSCEGGINPFGGSQEFISFEIELKSVKRVSAEYRVLGPGGGQAAELSQNNKYHKI